MKIKIKKLDERAIIPTSGTKYSAGYDLYLLEDVTINPHQNGKCPTGLAMEIPEGYFGAIFARSGLASKKSIRPSNCVAVIDSDYRGEITIVLHNDSNEAVTLNKNDRVAQIVIMPYLSVDFEQVDNLSETQRSSGGFGSTGK